MDIYSRINEIRIKKGITWKYLNENTPGKSYSSRMTELKNGKTTLSNEQLQAIAIILETSTDYLLGNTDDPSPAKQKEKSPAQDGGLGDIERIVLEKLGKLTPENLERAKEYLDLLLIGQEKKETS